MERRVLDDPQRAAEACSRYILGILKRTLEAGSYATLALSGGSTPKLLFERMVAARFNWDRAHLFWVDERPVPPDDEQSNYRLAKEYLIEPAGIPNSQVHRIHSELDRPRRRISTWRKSAASSGWADKSCRAST